MEAHTARRRARRERDGRERLGHAGGRSGRSRAGGRSGRSRAGGRSGRAVRAASAAAPACLVPGTAKPLDQLWRPDMRAAIAYSHTRRGDISFAVRTDQRFYGYRPDTEMMSASVVKAMLMVAFLDQRSVRDRDVTGYDRSPLIPMITESDNTAASEVRNIVGNGALLHRAFALKLLASIVPSQRWGIGEVAPKGWKLYFNGGWGYGTGLVDHQVALLTRGCARLSVAVLTLYDGTHAYGKATLRGIFARLLRGLPA